VSEELRAPLPSHLSAPHRRGIADYHSAAARAAKGAIAARRHPSERGVGRLDSSEGLLQPRPGELTRAQPPRSR
jgi:hypothetical protein